MNHHALSKPVGSLNVFKKRFGTSPEKNCLTAMPWRLFSRKLTKLTWDTIIFLNYFLFFDTN